MSEEGTEVTARRYAHTRPTPRLSNAADVPETPCVGRWDVYDVLIDRTDGPAAKSAVRAARDICAACPIAATCLRDNREEPWAKAIIGHPVTPAGTDTPQARAALTKHRANRAARLDALHTLVAAGADVDEACKRVGVSRSGLWKWCRKWGHDDLWAALNPDPARSNGYRSQPGAHGLSYLWQAS